jgi:hypothetical protein
MIQQVVKCGDGLIILCHSISILLLQIYLTEYPAIMTPSCKTLIVRIGKRFD